MLEKLKKIGAPTILRCLVLIILIVNMILVSLGIQEELFDFNETYDLVYDSLSAIALAISALWSAWKDNDITDEAIENKNSIEGEID